MKRSMTILIALALVMSLASCTFLDDLLSVNLFEETREPMTSETVLNSTINELFMDSSELAFFDGISESVKLELTTKIEEFFDTIPTDPQEIQEAAVLGADILIYTTEAGPLLLNVMNLADDLSETPTIDEVLNKVMPASMYDGTEITNPGLFIEMVDAFLAADVYYQRIGESLDGTYASPSINPDDIAVAAFISAAIAGIGPPIDSGVTTIEEYLTSDPYNGSLGAYLYEFMLDTSVNQPTFELPDFSVDGYLANIINASSLATILSF
jgi:hypothetical protein